MLLIKKRQINWIKITPWLICSVAALFYCYEYFLRVMPSVMQKQLMSTMHIDNALFGLLSAFYYYAYTAMQIPVGVLMDSIGPKKLLTWACLSCVGGSVLFASSNFGIASIGRFLVGFGSAFAFVGVLKLASIWLPKSRFAMIAGLVTVLGMFGPIMGDITLSPLVQKIGWQPTVLISALSGLILVIVLWFVIKDQNTQKTASPSFAHHKKNEQPFKKLLAELLIVFRVKQIWLAGIIACCLYLPIAVFAELWSIPYLEQAQHFPIKYAAYINPLLFAGFASGAVLFGWISDKLNKRREPLLLGSIMSLIFTCLLFYSHNLSAISVGLFLFLLSFFAGVEVITFAASREATEQKFSGTAIAITNFMTMMGGLIFQPVIGLLLDIHARRAHHSTLALTNSDYRYALAIVPACLFLSIILSCLVKNNGTNTQAL